MQAHQIVVSPQKYKNGLRIFECKSCRYAFAATVDEHGIIMHETRVPINHGDPNATHTLFQIPEETVSVEMTSELHN